MNTRKCQDCGASLSEDDVMKIEFTDGSIETIPLPVCPNCFKRHLSKTQHAP